MNCELIVPFNHREKKINLTEGFKMICHAKPVLKAALGALKNLRGNRLAENIDRRYLFFKRKKKSRSEKNIEPMFQ